MDATKLDDDAPQAAAPVVATPWPRPAYAWYVVVLLTLAFSFAILDRIAIGMMVGPIKEGLHITDAQIGLLQGLAFAICYTLFGLPVGVLADRWRRVPLIALGVAFWSAATVACGFARSFGGLFISRVGVGIGEATLAPGASSLIADYFPADRRARAFGFYMLGGSVGTGLSYLVTALALYLAAKIAVSGDGWLAGLQTWQITFFLIGLPGLFISVLFLLTVREPVRRGQAKIATKFSVKPVVEQIRGNAGAYAAMMLGPVLNIVAVYATLAWQPTLFMRVHQWNPGQVAVSLGSIAFVVGMTGAIVAGWTMAFLIRKGRNDAPVLMSLGHSASIILFNTAGALSPTPHMLLVFISISAIASNWSNAAALTGLNQITPNELRGQIVALYTLATGLISLTVGAFIVGELNDTVFTAPTGIAQSLAVVYFGCGLLAAIVLLFGRKAFIRAAERAKAWDEPSPAAATR